MSIRLRSGLALAATVALGAAVALAPSSAQSAKPEQPRLVPIQMLAINDFHGNLEPPSGSSGHGHPAQRGRHHDPADGGRRRLPRHPSADGACGPSRTPSPSRAGDNIGASPLLSGGLPRRADDPRAQPDGRCRSRRSATTSSTRAAPSCCACRTAAAGPTTAATTWATRSRARPSTYLAANVISDVHRQAAAAAVRGCATSTGTRSASSG